MSFTTSYLTLLACTLLRSRTGLSVPTLLPLRAAEAYTRTEFQANPFRQILVACFARLRRWSQYVEKVCPWLRECLIDESHLGNLPLFEELRYEVPECFEIEALHKPVMHDVHGTAVVTLAGVKSASH
jgi:hypothetical protein